MEDSRGTLCRNRRLFGTLERLRCGWAGQDCEGGEGRERAGSSCLFFQRTWLSSEWPPFPGNGISGPEKNAQKRPADCNDAVPENEPSHRSPLIRGLSYTFRKSPVAHDCVVGPGDVAQASIVNGLRVKQFQKAPLNANGFLSRCQN